MSVAALAVVFGVGQAAARRSTSKLTAAASNVSLVPPTASRDWTTVRHTWTRTRDRKDPLTGGSLQTVSYTGTAVKSAHRETDTSTAAATLDIRIPIDGEPASAWPAEVTCDKRVQSLSAKPGGEPAKGTDGDVNGVIDTRTGCLPALEIGLVPDTMAAHRDHFVALGTPAGVPTCELQIRIDTQEAFNNGSARVWAAVGRGSFTVEGVRSRNTEDGIDFVP